MTEPPAGWEGLLGDFPPEVGDLARRCRETIITAMPDATERFYPGWRGLGFHHPTAGYVCAVFPADDHVKVGFERGRLLADPDGLLTGTGSQVRYLVVTDWTDETDAAVDHFITQAIHLR